MPSSIFKQYQSYWTLGLFHLVFWTVWIGLPIINVGDHERMRQFYMHMIPVNLSLIIPFVLNTEWLIPRLLRQQGVGLYLFALIALVLFFSFAHLLMKQWLVPANLLRRPYDFFWSFTPVLFVTAISTGYGFIIYLRQQERDRQEEQAQKLKTELTFLRSQISPHFIFNVLNSIVYLMHRKPKEAEQTVMKLSALMRYVLYRAPEEQVTLQQEVAYLTNYIELQRIRFEEDVPIDFECLGEMGAQPIEPMLLIPFVENSFKHGVGMVLNPAISIQLSASGNSILLIVRNKIGSVDEDKDESSGIGLPNVRRRLELLYPNRHVLTIHENDGWFEVTLRLDLSDKRAQTVGKVAMQKSMT